ncbi:DUF2807 domain-containing protein [Caulobacter sp. CCNWLY153]|jgi:hypothetical protein|uniref:DUF2807 domain-containing protein n=1 Tax=Caulobacter radicis TaxID=2172650 RepID=A0A2T9K0I6_9CAUL|nr:DUF2807 domain-containing protein [Caulobacter radicis]PVM89460.1 DUF2807 domain-containing protein [Caulobacter radicis]
MIRNLTIIAVASFVLAVACLGTAFAIGGRDLVKQGGWSFPANIHIEDDDGRVTIRRNGDVTIEDHGPNTSRQIAWTGGEALRIDLPARVIFTQGDKAGITVEGPEGLARRVVLTNDRLHFDGDGQGRGFRFDRHGLQTLADRDDLVIRITAPAVRKFTLNGSGDLDIQSYDQPDLSLTLNGSGEAYASGKTGKVDLKIAGSGEAELTALVVTDAKVAIAGSGEAKLGPTGEADVHIAGSGDVTLTERPASLSRSIAGSGDINESW